MKLSMIQLMILSSLLASCSSKKPSDAKDPVGVDFKNQPTISGTSSNPVVRELSTADTAPKPSDDAKSYFLSGLGNTKQVVTSTTASTSVTATKTVTAPVTASVTVSTAPVIVKPVVVEEKKPATVMAVTAQSEDGVDASIEIKSVASEDIATTLSGAKTSAQMKKAAQNRLKIIDILTREEFQPGYPTWHGIYELGLPKKRGQMDGVGWQNAAAMAVVRENGFDDDILLNENDGVRSIDWTTSTKIRENLIKGSLNKESGIEEVSEEQAQELADRGRIIVVSAIFKKRDSSINLGFVLPSESGATSRGVKIAAVSLTPQIQTGDDWSRLNEGDVQFFAVPQKIEKSLAAKSTQGDALANIMAKKIGDAAKAKSEKEIAVFLKQIIALTKADESVVLSDKDLASANIAVVQANLEAALNRGDAALIGLEQGQVQANAGNVVIAISKGSKGNNISLVFPSADKYNTRVGAKLLVIGSSDISGLKTARAVSIDRGASLKLYVLRATK